MRRIDMTGRKYGGLTAIGLDRIENGHTFWKFRCDCGKTVVIDGWGARSGKIKSCGCFNAERIKKQRKFNEYKIADGYVKVKLNDENHMLCDIEDWERFNGHYWFMNDAGYAVCETMKTGTLRFHKLVTGTTAEVIIDHIDRNKLDNRKCNLRIATASVNAINRGLQSNNTSGHKGVRLNKHGSWVASITVNKKHIYIGSFKTKEEAVKARELAEEKYYKPLLEKAVPYAET